MHEYDLVGKAKTDFMKLSDADQKKVVEAVWQIAKNPRKNARALDSEKKFWTADSRVLGWRVVFCLSEDEMVVKVVEICRL
jgi:mRNA-degrading endonuclease RelE of RelBE toxin-antitoxin system